jgi:plastocyanin
MTLRWLIFFSAAVWLAQAEKTSAATITGQVQLANSREAAVRKRKDYSGVALWLEPVDRSVRPPLVPHNAEMVQRDKTFSPHVLIVQVGSTVDFPNFDPIFHNAFSNFSGQPFDVGLYPPGTSRSITFRRTGIVRVFCNIHSTMSAILVVTPTPWYAVTSNSGRFRIANVPPGEYQLHLFHERALPENLRLLERRIAVPESGLELPPISVSELGYIPTPHTNKYGKEYPPAPSDSGYAGGAK